MDGIGIGLGALGFWSFLAAVSVAGIFDGIKKRDAQHESLRRMVESGVPIDQALLDKCFGGNTRADRDLKAAGLIVVFVAPGLALLGALVGAILPLLGVAALVGCVGAGLLVAARTLERAYLEDESRAANPPG